MKLTITLDNLDEAISQLKELANKMATFAHDVAVESAENITYSGIGTTNSMVGSIPYQHVIVQNNDYVAFQEFGTGFEAEYTSIIVNDTVEASYPGVYSEDHERTFQDWTGDPEDYRPNITPKKQMQNEVQRLFESTEQKARSYFD